MEDRVYIAIDLKSFYASVECVERGLDPLTTNLVVADESRSDKTICLAVSPSLKSYGIPGRPRLFEVIRQVKDVNDRRLRFAPGRKFSGSETDDTRLRRRPDLALDYIVAMPRMKLYMDYSTRVFSVYSKYVSPMDIHVYSIDEVFIDATMYLPVCGLTPREFAMKLIHEVLSETGITATAGIGSNMYLAKVAMDIVAKHIDPDKNGVRVAALDERGYRERLWDHRPLTDFWRVGPGIARKLEQNGMYTMGDVARCSVGRPNEAHNEELLYKLFGVNAELLIDHAWGWEPCTIGDVKAYKPRDRSVGSGQVLQSPYPFEKARLIVREMTELLALDLVDKGLMANKLVLTVGYDSESLRDEDVRSSYSGQITHDRYGRATPKHAHGIADLGRYTSSTRLLTDAALELFDRLVDRSFYTRRVYISANVLPEAQALLDSPMDQLDLFTDPADKQREDESLSRERRMQEAILKIKREYGKNAILKGTNFEEGATTRERNRQVGGHRA